MADSKGTKVALVTGAGRGVGRAIAIRLAREGYSLALAARSTAELEETRKLSELPADKCLLVTVDLGTASGPAQLAKTVLDRFGAIEALVNNAGINIRRALLSQTQEEQDKLLAVNISAPLILTRALVPCMIERGGGTVVNISSGAARHYVPNMAVYSATKAAINSYTRDCFFDLREKKIKFCAMLLGIVDTAIVHDRTDVDWNKVIRPESVGEAVWQVISSAPEICPVEIELTPLHNPIMPR